MQNGHNHENHESGDGGALVVKPQSIGMAAEQQRVQAEIQARLTIAKRCPRDEKEAVDRIMNACQRVGLAEKAEYVYERGGQEITGATIDLMTVVANCWGNIDYGFRELSQQQGPGGTESTVEAYAWDLETNAKRTLGFTVPHKRHSKDKKTRQVRVTVLTDPRDIYESMANYAQRRVRKCLEDIIPPDIVEDAREECKKTLHAKADVTPEAITRLTAAFAEIEVTKDQIEQRLGRRLETMQPAQLVSLRRIYKSIKDGMSNAGDWFESQAAADGDESKSGTDKAKDFLRKRTGKSESPTTPDAVPEEKPDDAAQAPPDASTALDEAIRRINSAKTPEEAKAIHEQVRASFPGADDCFELDAALRAILKDLKPSKIKQGDLV